MVEHIVRELLTRGWRVMSARPLGDRVLIGVEFMGGRAPTWLKAFEVPAVAATPDAVEADIVRWQMKVLRELAEGRSSPLVRRMIAEHGQDAVVAAMTGRGRVLS